MQGWDWTVLAAYAATIVGVGAWAGRREETTDDFFLAGRTMPWLPVAASSLATSLSALTFIGVPGAAFGGNFTYLQLWAGTFVASVLVAWMFLPVFYRLGVTTVYELLGDRFGPVTRTAGVGFFVVSRVLASAVRLAGCAIAVSVFFGLELSLAIVLIAACATLYTVSGGIKAVIWTDLLQLVLFVVGALVTLGLIWHRLPGGFDELLATGQAHGKFETFNFAWSVDDPSTFWAGNFFAVVLGLATGATDQDMAQRLLTCREVGGAQRAAVTAGAATLLTTLLFLTVGASLFAYYEAFPSEAVASLIAQGKNDYVFPHFIQTALPAGVRGLVVAALLAAAMSSLDSALNGLASATFADVLRPLGFGAGNDATSVRISRGMVIVFALALTAVALRIARDESILWLGLKIMGYTYGALLGVFLLALARRGGEVLNVFAMLTSVAVVLFLTTDVTEGLSAARVRLLAPVGVDVIAWPWAVVIGTAWTFGIGATQRAPKRGGADPSSGGLPASA